MGAWTLFKKVVEEKSGFYEFVDPNSENVTDYGEELKNRLYCMEHIKEREHVDGQWVFRQC